MTTKTPRLRGARRTAYVIPVCVLAALFAGPLVAGPAAADDPGAGVTHVELAGDRLQALVAVPADREVDLDGVTMQIGDVSVDATAEPAGEGRVRRTAVLAIDTSDSMRGERAEAAHDAAITFLDTVPTDVYVGIVTFDGEVASPLAPSLDRDQARAVIDGLEFGHGTRLFDGVEAAIDLAGDEGQRSLLVLSDGADTTKTPLSDVTAALEKAHVYLDAVALDSSDPSLATLARAGSGEVISADPAALTAAFAAEADILSRQVLVTATVPDKVTTTEANVSITLPTDADPLTLTAYTTVREGDPAEATTVPAPAAASAAPLQVPGWLMLAGVGALGAGLLLLLLVLVPAKPKPLGAAARVDAYIGGHRAAEEARQTEALAPVREAATKMLSRNRGLEERIGLRLEGAGSELRPPEWLLIHAGIAVATTLLLLLLGGGSVLLGVIGLVIGVVGPWVYLGFRRSRRRKAFNAALPDALQLMAGALEAGLSLSQSADTIVKEGIEPIASEFRRALVETRLGVNLEDALDGVAERLVSEDLGWVVMAIRIQRPIGGNLAELLGTVAATMREREYMRRQVAALAAEGKLSAWVLGGLPPAFLLYLLISNRDYVMPLFTTPMGLAMLLGAGLLLSVGVFWMSKMVKVDV